jgi:hypothetical protein
MVGNNLLTLELGSPSAGSGFGVGFRSNVLVTDRVTVKLVTDGSLTATDGTGDCPGSIAFIS